MIDAFAGIELKGQRVLLFHYGERSDTLAETFVARQAILASSGFTAGACPRPRASND